MPTGDSSLQVPETAFSFKAFTPTLSVQTEKPLYANLAVTALSAVDDNPETKNAGNGKKEGKGNDKVYRYYFKASGRRNIAAFLACVFGLVFGLYFPRTYHHPSIDSMTYCSDLIRDFDFLVDNTR